MKITVTLTAKLSPVHFSCIIGRLVIHFSGCSAASLINIDTGHDKQSEMGNTILNVSGFQTLRSRRTYNAIMANARADAERASQLCFADSLR